MKKILLALGGFLVINAFTIIADPSQLVAAKWKLDEGSIEPVTKSMIEATKKRNPALAEQMEAQIEEVKDMIRQATFDYKADKTYVIEMPSVPLQKGTWTISPDGKHMIVTREGRPNRTDSILELSEGRMKIYNNERGDTSLYVHFK